MECKSLSYNWQLLIWKKKPMNEKTISVPLWSEYLTPLFKCEDCMILSCRDETSNSIDKPMTTYPVKIYETKRI